MIDWWIFGDDENGCEYHDWVEDFRKNEYKIDDRGDVKELVRYHCRHDGCHQMKKHWETVVVDREALACVLDTSFTNSRSVSGVLEIGEPYDGSSVRILHDGADIDVDCELPRTLLDPNDSDGVGGEVIDYLSSEGVIDEDDRVTQLDLKMRDDNTTLVTGVTVVDE